MVMLAGATANEKSRVEAEFCTATVTEVAWLVPALSVVFACSVCVPSGTPVVSQTALTVLPPA